MIFDGELNKNDILQFQSEGMYGVLVDNSNIQLQYSICVGGKAYSSTFRNSKAQYVSCSGNSLLFEDVIWLNSIVNKDKDSEKDILRSPSFYRTNLIQTGSYTGIKSPININTNSISGNGGIVDQDFFFSGYLINNRR